MESILINTKHFVLLSLILALYLYHAAALSFPLLPSQVAISANICEISCLPHSLNQVWMCYCWRSKHQTHNFYLFLCNPTLCLQNLFF